jgi:hypothetical protein
MMLVSLIQSVEGLNRKKRPIFLRTGNVPVDPLELHMHTGLPCVSIPWHMMKIPDRPVSMIHEPGLYNKFL